MTFYDDMTNQKMNKKNIKPFKPKSVENLLISLLIEVEYEMDKKNHR